MPITRSQVRVQDEDGSVYSYDELREFREHERANRNWAERVVPNLPTRDTLGDDTLWEGRDTARDPDSGVFPRDKGVQWDADPNMKQTSPDELHRRQQLEGILDNVGREVSYQVGRTQMDFEADRDLGRNVLRRVEVVEVDDSGPIQKVIVMGLADEYFEMPLRGQQHGMTGNPRPGAVGYVMMANGRPDQAFLMGLEHPDDRKTDIAPGETKTYGSAGQEIHHDKDGNIIIKTPGICHINPP